MAKSINRLTTTAVRTAGEGWHHDGNGLYLQCTESAAGGVNRNWVFRYAYEGRERRMGLGKFRGNDDEDDVSLAKARELADKARALRKQGVDPIHARDEEAKRAKTEKEEQARAAATAVTFRQAFEKFFADKTKSLSNDRHISQWRSTLTTHARAILDRPVAEIEPDEILTVLRPIWFEKPETARRTVQRMDTVFKYANVFKMRKAENPCSGVTLVLGRNHREVRHHPALPYAEVPAFLFCLRESNSWPATRLAFEWLILTATRSGETRLARWHEIDENAAEWRIPSERMKAKKLHIVPLSLRCLGILQALKAVYPHGPGDLLFPSMKAGAPLSDMTMTKVLRDLGLGERATAHGFRSSFRNWTTEVAKAREVVAEAALAHTVKDKTEKAYRRATYLDERKVLMQAWATFCANPVPADTVVRFPERAAT